ncbi:class I SAM-dependent methyltransferase [Arthrobacter sp. ES3-54]|uniref:class I SAM-dependent methyltransferase n=1 Tax=Arthrobacter sp. ES3-54 TaxID=1502991 RepID=UPI0024058CE0|nr:class I SAM-dependent methyltransferase [Arthrobacter sp. ES3-54]MDF9750702.1 ubiquinone/menaquinone biosynthesis C-methylase UbiE [Arthrobacter sp. ES3-54]
MANENLMDVRSAYDTVAEAYSTVIPDTTFEAALDMAMVDHFVGHMRATADRQVIDVGCGAGRMTSYLSRAGLNVSGVDLSPEMVRVAQRLHPELLFEVGELTELPVADAAADGVLAWYSIIHSPPTALPAIAREFWRALRPGGSALVALHAGTGHHTIDRAYGHDVQLRAELHAPDDVALRFTEQGFVMRAQLVRSARSVEKHPQAAILVDKPFVAS